MHAQSLLIRFHRRLDLVPLHESTPQAHVCLDIVGLHADRFLEVIERLVDATQLEGDVASVVVGLREGRLQADRLVEMGGGLFPLLHGDEHVAPVEMRLGIFRLPRQAVAQAIGRFRQVALPLQRREPD